MVAGRHNHIHASEHAFGGIDDLDLTGYTTLSEIRYAKPTGNNANDGLTWGTAKQDVLAAYDALPSGGGTIHYVNGTQVDSANTTRGLWLAGDGDSNYPGSLPTGWRARKRLHLVGQPFNEHSSSARKPQAHLAGGHSTDGTKPTIWISGGGGPITFENVNIHFPAVGMRIGLDSNGTSTFTNTAGMNFVNIGIDLNQVNGNGPAVEVGYGYWLNFYDCVFGGNVLGVTYTITAASITGGTTARFTIGTHTFKVGDQVWVEGVTPAGYNGAWIVTAVAATTFDADIGTSPGAGSAFGTVEGLRTYRRAAMAFDAIDIHPGGGANAGLWVFENCIFNGGFIHYAPSGATSSGNLVVRNCTYEGAFVNHGPPMVHFRTGAGGIALPSALEVNFAQNLSMADTGGLNASVKLDGLYTNPDVLTAINAGVEGNCKASFLQPANRQSFSPAHGYSAAEHRAFGPTTARFTNLLSTDPTTWQTDSAFGGDSTVTTGLSAPDGTTNAGSITGSGGTAQTEIYRANVGTPSVGGWVIAGVWRRLVSGTDDSSNSNNYLNVGLSSTNDLFDNGTNGFGVTAPVRMNDGAWDWYYAAYKITVAPDAAELIVTLSAGDGNTVAYAYPVMCYITSGSALDDDEMRNLGRYMRSWPKGVTQGNIGIFKDQKLEFAPDVNLYRSAASVLKTDDKLLVAPPSTGSQHDILEMQDGFGRRLRFTGESDEFRLIAGSSNLFRFKESGEIALEAANMFLGNGYLVTGSPTRFAPLASSDIGLAIRGVASQSADLFQVQDSGTAVLAKIDNTGAITHKTNKAVLDTDHTAAADPHTGYVLESLADAKGDIIAATAADTFTRLPVGGTNGHVLTVASGQATGMEWAAPTGGGATINIEEDNAAVGAATTVDFGTGLDVSFAAGEADVTVDLGEVTAFTDHSARHENGGADEISLAGLDGTPTELTNHAAAADPHTGYVLESLLDAKGDVIAATADNTPARVAVGANGTVLTADSGAAAGVSWQTAGGSHPSFITHTKFGAC